MTDVCAVEPVRASAITHQFARHGACFDGTFPLPAPGMVEPTLEPLMESLCDGVGWTEIIVAWFVPAAHDAMIALGRLNDAEQLVDMLERHSERLDRAWLLPVATRCRAMLLAAQGHIEAASVVAKQAMAAHERVVMPFERARTQLLLGQLLRRQRQKGAAATTLSEAVKSFESMGADSWAARARRELKRARVARNREALLTPTELRVAQLAASGMRNRDIAAALFVSPKTVEVNLTRIYRKLAIRSRVELGRYTGAAEVVDGEDASLPDSAIGG